MHRFIALAGAILVAVPVLAQRGEPQNVVSVSLGGSSVVDLGGARGRVTLTDPSVAEITPAGAGLLVIGRKVGETNLILTGSGGQETWLIKVSLPAQAIQAELRRMFPREDIDARAVGGALVLVGVVSDTPLVKQAEDIALGYLASPSIAALGVKPNVINLLTVRARQQVQLEVKFAEVSRRSLREMGVNGVGGLANGRVGAATGRTGVGDTDPRPKEAGYDRQSTRPGVPGQVFTPNEGAVGAIFVGLRDGKFPFAATLNLLAVRDLSRTLAEPTLVSMSGQTARFLAGGEVPILKPSGLGSVTIEYKPFGIELGFSPTVMEDRTIHLQTNVAVSALDPTLNVVLDGFSIPGFKKREGSTSLRLRDGQSFAMAGLLSDEIANVVQKVPGLGDIPILGALFSSKSFVRRETELVVVVTARLVEPLDGEAPILPGEDRSSDPTDLELFFLNVDEPSRKRRPDRFGGGNAAVTPRRQLVGRVGFWR